MTDQGVSNFKLQRTEFKLLPPDTYEATITGLTIQSSTNPEYGDQFRWRFAVNDPESGDHVDISGWTGKIYSTRSKTYEWVMAVLGVSHEQMPEYLTADIVIGHRVRILVVSKQKSDGTPVNRVDRILGPVKPGRAQAAAAAVAATIPGAQVKYTTTRADGPDIDSIPF